MNEKLSSDGAARIANERLRQRTHEKYSGKHDDEHSKHQLADAALCYLEFYIDLSEGIENLNLDPLRWPWEYKAWKPSSYAIRNLEKAGALIAAEIDRLLRIEGYDVPAN